MKFKRGLTAYSLRKFKLYEVIIFWLKSILTRSQFLILSGILVGGSAGLAGVILKSLVHAIHNLITHKVHFETQIFFYAIFPFLGIVLTSLVVILFFGGQDRKGIPAILHEIAQNSSIVAPVKMYSQVIQSAITVGLGGSAGLESPIAVTGSAIGSNFARVYKLDYRERTLLLAAGATGGIASAFNAPIAGMMFAVEILLTGVVFTDFIPLVLAAVCGNVLSRMLLNEEVLFHFSSRHPFNYYNLPFYLVLGILCGLYARYFVVIGHQVERFFANLKGGRLRKAMIGGAILSALCVLYPPLFGEGYETIKALVNGQVGLLMENSFFGMIGGQRWAVLVFLTIVCLLKAFASSITIFSGGNGGNFAPSLFAGGTLGFVFAVFCNFIGISDVPVANLVLVGMAGVMSGVLYAPLTAIFLIAESSSGYDLFIPLMVVGVMAFLISKWFSPISPDLKRLADEGKIFTREHDRNLLSQLNTWEFIDRDAPVVNIDLPFGNFLDVVHENRHSQIAVVDNEGILRGIISIEDLYPYLFTSANEQNLSIASLMRQPAATVADTEPVARVIARFDQTSSGHLPVTDPNGRYIGFISKTRLLDRYRSLLQAHSG
ncbi:chloride channel protein [Dyadobacter sp. OTU695]|uniref:chloride channel protein n=1 Tax=Dyadobacter sp. OTU695 TaxID=3043860 RepID=UPI00313D9FCB